VTTEVLGNYFLKLKFGEDDIPLDTSSIQEFTIVQDIMKLVPAVRINLKDTRGVFTHLVPGDHGMTNLSVQLSRSSIDASDWNAFDFEVYRKKPESVFSSVGDYDIIGLLQVKNMFTPDQRRAFTDKVIDTLESLALNDMDLDKVEISPGLSQVKQLIQANWSNAEFLNFYKKRLLGKNGEAAFQCFVKCVGGDAILVFRGLDEMYKQQVKFRFIVNPIGSEDLIPIFSYEIFDNYKLLGMFGSKEQNYGYFDWDSGAWVTASEPIDAFYSLSEFFNVDSGDPEGSKGFHSVGRSNDFDGEFVGKVRSSYWGRLNGLVKMWVLTLGLTNIAPGDMIDIVFGAATQFSDLFSYQYAGFWMVERVVHMVGKTFKTRLLLTRNGLDTDKETSLLKAVIRKRR